MTRKEFLSPLQLVHQTVVFFYFDALTLKSKNSFAALIELK